MNSNYGIFKSSLRFMRPISPVVDLIMTPFTLLAIVWFRIVRFWGIKNLKIAQNLFLRMGMIPVVDHYYEPLIDYRKLPASPRKTHLKLNGESQLKFISRFSFVNELISIPITPPAGKQGFYYHNGSFGSGDAELYYSIIRHYKPSRIIEVGCGFSTLIGLEAIKKNRENDQTFQCDVTCIEPFEMPFLESLGIRLIRLPVELTDIGMFSDLQAGDILFIDSSHIIRAGGDVNFLILQVLPVLNQGVLIHFHDIFIPQPYPVEWLRDEYRLWNEQYLLEAFLLGNDSFKIEFCLSYMHQYHPSAIGEKFPILMVEPERSPGSIWLRKVR